MSEAAENEGKDGLFFTDKELSRRLGFCEKTGAGVIRRLELTRAGRPFPQRDKNFANRRFWPAVVQWLLDYHGVRVGETTNVVPLTPWKENFDEPAPKASEPKRPRSHLASA
jgi:hypothetical protein